jgi:polyhydroxyalkanoate synthesis regulator protein
MKTKTGGWVIVLAFLFFVCTSLSAQQAPTEPTTTSNPATVPPEKQSPLAIKEDEKPLSPEQVRDLVRRAMENDLQNYKTQKDLTHIERQQTDQLSGKGELKKSESVTREIIILYGERVQRVLERNDKPLSGDDARKEQKRFDKAVAELAKESPQERQKRVAKFEEDSQKAREFVKEVANAYDFTLIGEEMLNGRPAYVVQAEQRPDYKPNSRETKILTKMHGKIWIDVATTHWVKIDAEFTDTVSFGLFLARIRKGTRAQVEQTLFRDQVWVPREVKFKLDARIALFKQMFANVNVTFRDWRKFTAESKITGFAETEQKPVTKPTETNPPPQ